VDSYILRLQSDLHNFDSFHQEVERNAFSVISALVLNCAVDLLSLAYVKKHKEIRDDNFSTCKSNDKY
jgi:hypothetical protein